MIGKSMQERGQRRGVLATLAVAAAIAASAALPLFGVGQSMTVHMATHAVAMNLFAPGLCLMGRLRLGGRHVLILASVLQVALLAFWHMPTVMAYNGPIFRVLMHTSLICAACVFWAAIVESDRRHAVKGIAALLMTGKLVCLGGVILVLAPRPLYFGTGHVRSLETVGDQQLAGLVMLATCSLTYISGAIVLFWRWLSDTSPAAPVRILG